MRELLFVVSKQYLGKSQKGDFSNVIKGTSNYLQCSFTFDSDWNGFIKVAEFIGKEKPKTKMDKLKNTNVTGESYGQIIKDGKCNIPNEVTKYDIIMIRVIGKKGEQRIVTNFVEVEQEE